MTRLAIFAALLAVAGLSIRARANGTSAEHIVTYEIRVRGEVDSDLELFRDHVRKTLRHPDGWSMDGEIRFLPVAENGDFVIWLADATELPGFSEVCSVDWSCRVGKDVVINETRWEQSAPGWTGDLDTYRHYVVNHEMGHWMGLGHRGCEVEGEPAPVMMQQSKSAVPCSNRVWPDPVEIADARANFLAR